eukprot:XP_011435563.2 PREDICTED: uncharacterized protein LOC105334004 [Crassostrea gigas]
MDGPDMISQCPILPGQTFEYRFVASPAGTHWYHGHVHTLRSDGLAGAFIVLPRIRPPITTPSEQIPEVKKEFSVVIFDWMKTTAHEKFQARRGGFAVLEDYDGQCLPATVNYDGSGFLFQVHIGLINGKGQRYINDDPTLPERDYLPLETFSVKQNQYYRFRTINAGFESAFEISVDDHMLTIVAFDGNNVVPYQADIVVIQPGERVDFIIFTNRPADNYRINYLTTAIGDFSGRTFTNRRGTYAILNYQGVDENASPIVKKRVCTPIVPCLAVNQIFGDRRYEIFTPDYRLVESTAPGTDRKLTKLKYTRPVYRLVETYSDLRNITDCTDSFQGDDLAIMGVLIIFLMIFVATHAETKTGNCKDLLEGYLAGRLSSEVGGNHVETLRREFKTSQEKAIRELKEKLETDIHTLKATRNTSVVYTRWGKKECPNGSEPIHSGGAVEPLCLPRNPEWGIYKDGTKGGKAYIYGAEYETSDLTGYMRKLHDHDVPCAVCLRRNKSAVKMFPARKTCYKGWKLEYRGYLMAGYYTNSAGSKFTCIDANPDTLHGGHASTDGYLFYLVEAQCGSLKCPPYVNGRVLVCVVCSKE